MLTLADRVIDLESGDIEPQGRLTQFECRLLRYLVQAGGNRVTRDELQVVVWDYPKPIQTRAVDTAIRRLRQKIETQPTNPRHLLTVQGEGYRWAGPGLAAEVDDPAEIVRRCTAALKHDPLAPAEEIELRLERFSAQRSLGQTGRAEVDLDACFALVEAAPQLQGRVSGARGILAATTADWPQAEEAFRNAVQQLEETSPGQAARFWAELAIVQWIQGKTEALDTAQQARTLGEQAIILHPDSPESRDGRNVAARAVAAILMGLERTWEAIPRLEALTDNQGAFGVVVRNSLAVAFMEMGDLESAARWQSEAVALCNHDRPQLALSLNGRGVLRFLEGDLTAAQTDLNMAITILEDLALPTRTIVPRCWLAITTHLQNLPDLAQRMMQTVLAMPTTSPGVQGVVSAAATRLGLDAPEVPPEAKRQAYYRLAATAFGHS